MSRFQFVDNYWTTYEVKRLRHVLDVACSSFDSGPSFSVSVGTLAILVEFTGSVPLSIKGDQYTCAREHVGEGCHPSTVDFVSLPGREVVANIAGQLALGDVVDLVGVLPKQ